MSEFFNCGTFDVLSFGESLRKFRVKRKITLRSMCKKIGVDPGNYSRLERSESNPPDSLEDMLKYFEALKLTEQEKTWLISQAYQFHLSRLKKKFEVSND